MTTDPPRLLEATNDASLRAMLDAGRSELPSAERLASMATRLGSATTGVAAGKTLVSTLGVKIFLAVLIVVAVALGLLFGGVRHRTQTAPTVVLTMAPSSSTVSVPATSVVAPPPAAPSPFTSASASTPPPAIVAPVTTASVAAPSETELLRDAQAALFSDPGAALRLAEEHRRLYPKGALAQEREVIAIDALVRLGRPSDAHARAKRFLEAFPDSPHLARIEAILGGAP